MEELRDHINISLAQAYRYGWIDKPVEVQYAEEKEDIVLLPDGAIPRNRHEKRKAKALAR